MRRVISIIVALCMILLAAMPISANQQKSFSKTTESQTLNSQTENTYYDIVDIPDNIHPHN